MTDAHRIPFPSILDKRVVAGVVLAFALDSAYQTPYVSRELPESVVVDDSGRNLIDKDLDGLVDIVRVRAPTRILSYIDLIPTLQDQATFTQTLSEYRDSLSFSQGSRLFGS